ncbi:PREDICTED: arrestin domain-containing protein 5 [Pygoscelis adeliae]|uniref:arrestin domain-containing protein 5 n=1 Tax=Pygoscelis adeliae TaxID=9238 RepID=UPI0004F4E2F4|nr:PREDICTED: arrestin domain-containing protein 5 [Pygoscelis adeliae]
MSTVTAINLVLPEIEVHLDSSSIDGQLVLNPRSTLVDPVMKVELMGRGYLRWLEEDNSELDYHKSMACTNQAIYVSKAKNFLIEGSVRNPENLVCRSQMAGWRDSGVHTSNFHFSFPPNIPSTFTDAQEDCDNSAMSHSVQRGRLSSGKNIFCPDDTIVFMTDIANRTCKYVRKVIFAVHCIVLYSGFSSRGEQCSLEDQVK